MICLPCNWIVLIDFLYSKLIRHNKDKKIEKNYDSHDLQDKKYLNQLIVRFLILFYPLTDISYEICTNITN